MKTAKPGCPIYETSSFQHTVGTIGTRNSRNTSSLHPLDAGNLYLKSISFITFFFVAGILNIHAQKAENYALHANIIYHFTKYIDWPDDKKSGDFIIGVTGETPLYDQLKTNVANKMVGKQRIVIQQFSSSANSFHCHILFVSEDESSYLKKIVATSAGTAMLVVSEMEGLARKGSCINFVIVNERLKLEINTNNIEQRSLSIASELLQLGKIVK